MSYLIRGQRQKGAATRLVAPGTAELRYLEFNLLTLADGQSHLMPVDEQEAVVYLLAGKGRMTGEALPRPLMLGPRTDVFTDGPWAAYLPPRTEARITADRGALEAAIVRAPGGGRGVPVVVTPPDVPPRSVGAGNWRRTVYNVIDPTRGAGRLMVGETVNPPGNWSSFPPHKHDARTVAGELPMEEIYYYRTRPPGGFGTQLLYTAPGDSAPIDVAYRVETGDLVVIPRGYHPVVAAPGYELFYLWAMAGEESRYGAASDDPAHVWVRERMA